MKGKVVALKSTWTVGKRLDGGGFGEVYEATSESGDVAVAKFVPQAPGADRELLFVDLGEARNVVPILDSGEFRGYWVLVMPRADTSLRRHLEASRGALDIAETLAVLEDISDALADLDGKVVHRDIKPENVLRLDGRWCVADFGISRYAEATTAPDTQRFAMSAPYAAPERWRAERATSAALVDECLYKAPGARPLPANVRARLERLGNPSTSAGLTALQEANRAEVRTEAEQRSQLADGAERSFERFAEMLRNAIVEAAPSVVQKPERGGWSLQLNNAVLSLSAPRRLANVSWGGWNAPAFDVVAVAQLNLRIPADRHGYEGRSHSLWFGDVQVEGQFAWFESAFMISALIARRGRQDPFSLDPGEEAAKAVWNGMADFQMAWPFTPLVVGELDEFVDRWGGWFAAASDGRLGHPSSMPERSPQGSWRR